MRKRPKPFVLGERDQILCAYAEPANGPGWSNSPIWCIVRLGNGVLKQECFQPENQTEEMWILYSISKAAHEAMTSAARRAINE